MNIQTVRKTALIAVLTKAAFDFQNVNKGDHLTITFNSYTLGGFMSLFRTLTPFAFNALVINTLMETGLLRDAGFGYSARKFKNNYTYVVYFTKIR